MFLQSLSQEGSRSEQRLPKFCEFAHDSVPMLTNLEDERRVSISFAFGAIPHLIRQLQTSTSTSDLAVEMEPRTFHQSQAVSGSDIPAPICVGEVLKQDSDLPQAARVICGKLLLDLRDETG